ncbi:hypothetical protein DPMN_133972 [Dreissena polymorpha]|uniref:Uncharacterized protein n=1 Tax=Dreissena polymorpha TaxID=45954 RepID=A0A9D4FWJ0_DREPO|nr:hypothetical protein DPMN_133972 [Dreissena polymorpha]
MQAYVVFVIAMEIAMRMSANDLSNDNKRLVLHTDVDTAAELIHLKQLVHGKKVQIKSYLMAKSFVQLASLV